MIPSRKLAAVLLAILASAAAAAYSGRAQSQEQATPSPAPLSQMNHNLVVIDPAHGGPDSGVSLGNNVPEKFNTLALAGRLRNTLASSGFTVVATRDADSSDLLTTDQRAETANRTHAVACIVLHATTLGSGVHIYTSTLPPSDPDPTVAPSAFVPVSWDTAQAAAVSQSLRLADDLKAALAKANLPVQVAKAAVRPLDNLMCPAVAIEIAPLAAATGESTPDTDANYQQRVADALAAALRSWRTHAEPPASPQAPTPPATAAPSGTKISPPVKKVPQ